MQDRGEHIISFVLPDQDCDLQELASSWHAQDGFYALTDVVKYVPVLLGRCPQHCKSFAKVRFEQTVNLPVFQEGVQCRWVSYTMIAGVIHYGQLPSSGHNRAILRSGGEVDGWHETDDGVTATGCEITEMHRGNLYVLWLKRAD